jgi:type I restriction enzyme S subunit
MSFPRYSEYKDSGVEWLGKVPKHWQNMSLKRLASICNGKDYKEVGDVDGAYPVMGSGGEFARASSYLFNGESVLLGRKGTIDKPLYINGSFWAVDTMFYTEIAKHAFPKFVYYVALNIPFGRYSTNTALPSMTGEDLSSHPIVAPNFDEQKAIANYLDHETSKIDTLVAEQEKLIKLLNEKRQAVISHAVTRGLDPTVKMKNTGVEWLGMVPDHWQISKGRRLFEIKKRIVGELGFDILSITQKGIRIKDIVSNDGQLSMDYSKYQLVEIGDFAMNHMDLLTGFVDLSTVLGVTSPDYRVFSIKDDKSCYPEYFLYLLQNAYLRKIFYPYGQGSSQLGRWRMPTEQFNDFSYPFPPIEEQKKIAIFISNETKKIDGLMVQSEHVIQLLRERRSALISTTVTGQIDVRNYKPKEVA